MNLPFQLAGNIDSKPAEFGQAPSPFVATDPFTSQYCGFGATAGTSLADVIVTFGTPRVLSSATLQSVAEAKGAPMTQTSRLIDGMRALSPPRFTTYVTIVALQSLGFHVRT